LCRFEITTSVATVNTGLNSEIFFANVEAIFSKRQYKGGAARRIELTLSSPSGLHKMKQKQHLKKSKEAGLSQSKSKASSVADHRIGKKQQKNNKVHFILLPL
jgi:hypothetical protein